MALRDIIGQEKALRILSGMIRKNRVPAAMLFSGEAGIGKKSAAISYAKALNCIKPADYDCCDECASCRKIDASMHPDVLVIALENVEDTLSLKPKEGKDKNRYEYPIEAVHKIEEFLYMSPYEGRKKIVIINDADAMNSSAANAFLKTLEEPTDNSIIILISSNPDKLPDTIRSRCINIRFYPLPLDRCREVILKNIDARDMNYIVNLAMGRPGLAVSRDFIKEREWFEKLLKSMIHDESRDLWTNKNEIKMWFDMAFVVLRDMIVYKITERESDLILGRIQEAESRKQKIKDILDFYQDIEHIAGLLDFNLNKSITWNYAASIMRQCGAIVR